MVGPLLKDAPKERLGFVVLSELAQDMGFLGADVEITGLDFASDLESGERSDTISLFAEKSGQSDECGGMMRIAFEHAAKRRFGLVELLERNEIVTDLELRPQNVGSELGGGSKGRQRPRAVALIARLVACLQ